MSEREAFEAWAFENGLQSHTDQSLDYPLGNVLWKCWQGRAAIEAQRVPDGLKDARDFLTAVVGAFGPDGDGTSFTAETWDKIHESISVLLAAAPPVAQRCPNCDDTGDVHTIDGQWRGTCHCPAGQAINARQAQPAERKPLTTNEVIRLWHEDDVATRRPSAFEWYAAGILVAERAHGIGD